MVDFKAALERQKSVIKGSLTQISKEQGQPLAASFLSADCVVLVDVSSSMEAQDAPGGKSRYDAACSELAALQNNMPGKIAVIAFSQQTVFCPNGIPLNMGGSTDLAGALKFSKVADVPDMRFVVISDGQPDSPSAALETAKDYQNRIDTIYVGSEISPSGREFLIELAKRSGGKATTAACVKQLSTKVQMLLTA